MTKPTKFTGWKLGHDPNDPDSVAGSPWQFVQREEEPTPPAQAQPKMKYSIDTGVTCYDCHHDTYRQIDDVAVDEVRGWGIGRQEFHDVKVLLICPRCLAKVVMYLSDLKELQHELEVKSEP
jgi:hypothetical protein